MDSLEEIKMSQPYLLMYPWIKPYLLLLRKYISIILITISFIYE